MCTVDDGGCAVCRDGGCGLAFRLVFFGGSIPGLARLWPILRWGGRMGAVPVWPGPDRRTAADQPDGRSVAAGGLGAVYPVSDDASLCRSRDDRFRIRARGRESGAALGAVWVVRGVGLGAGFGQKGKACACGGVAHDRRSSCYDGAAFGLRMVPAALCHCLYGGSRSERHRRAAGRHAAVSQHVRRRDGVVSARAAVRARPAAAAAAGSTARPRAPRQPAAAAVRRRAPPQRVARRLAGGRRGHAPPAC